MLADLACTLTLAPPPVSAWVVVKTKPRRAPCRLLSFMPASRPTLPPPRARHSQSSPNLPSPYPQPRPLNPYPLPVPATHNTAAIPSVSGSLSNSSRFLASPIMSHLLLF
ncbi:hypothetical protein K432DRAFT_237321 [Lepidopterella palustris CBS 459.81]|uniref:Uncharacterized protein n=1 Tax=Lepidopterella palustris CBS 459.81 TaxID=1314670 RepID=A0A8E2DXK0_9PEZI|nr:hypothetical protein K432DRAFT_237321 [Lepidopterella palustris CBS 459.81]